MDYSFVRAKENDEEEVYSRDSQDSADYPGRGGRDKKKYEKKNGHVFENKRRNEPTLYSLLTSTELPSSFLLSKQHNELETKNNAHLYDS